MKTSRREFLGAMAASPILLGMQDKAGSKAPVMGSGAYTFEAIHDWGVLPPQIKWGNTHGVVEDAQGHIYVHHTVHATSDSADTVVVFDALGKVRPIVGLGVPGRRARPVDSQGGPRRVPVPHRQRRQPEDVSAAADAGCPRQDDAEGRDRLEDRTAAGLRGLQAGADGAPKPYNPTNVAIAPNGDIYVADGYGSYFVNQYSSKAEYIRSFGGRGSEPGKLAEPHGIWVDTRGSSPVLVVADRRNNRLQRFTMDGKHVDFITGFRLPGHFDERQGLVVIPDLHGRVTLMDKTNALVAQLGDSNDPNWNNPLRREPRDKFIPGQFICPHGACFDHNGNIFVVEWVEVGRVTKLRRV